MNAQNARQFINTDKPLGLQPNYNDAFPAVHKEITTPNPVMPKQWREPLQVPTPVYAQEPRDGKWPSPYALIGYAFVAFFFIYGIVEMGFVMWHAFLQAIR